MNQTDKDSTPVNNSGPLKEESSPCDAGCGCHAGGVSSRTRWGVGAVVLVIASTLVARTVMRSDSTSAQTSESAFAAPVGMMSEPAAPADASANDTSESKPMVCGESIQTLGDLNRKATDNDAVFVFLAGSDADKTNAAVGVVEKAADTIRGRGINMGLFTIAYGSREYTNLTMQVPPPGVLAMVKGRGAAAVSGDITESKLMQAFVAASTAGGGCGPSGCGPSGCR